MPKLFRRNEIRDIRNNKERTKKNLRGLGRLWSIFVRGLEKLWGFLKYILLTLAVFLLITAFFTAFWQRAEIELLLDDSVAGTSQLFVFLKLLNEYVTSPEVILGFASFGLALLAYLYERSQKERERNERVRDQIQRLSSSSFLEQLRKYVELEKRSDEESWPEYLIAELHQIRDSFSEREFLWEIGKHLEMESNTKKLADIQKLYDYFFNLSLEFKI